MEKNLDMLAEELNEIMYEPIHHSQHILFGMTSSSCNQVVGSKDGLVVQSNIVFSHVKVKRIR